MQTDRVGRAEQSVKVKEREPVSQSVRQSVSQSVSEDDPGTHYYYKILRRQAKHTRA